MIIIITRKNLSVCYTDLKTNQVLFFLDDLLQWKYWKSSAVHMPLSYIFWYSIWRRLVEKLISLCIFMPKNVFKKILEERGPHSHHQKRIVNFGLRLWANGTILRTVIHTVYSLVSSTVSVKKWAFNLF